MTLKSLLFSIAIACFLVAFQNCTNSQQLVFSSNDSSKSAPTETDSGQSYDGKIYVQLSASACLDKTYIQSEIVLSSATRGNLVRKDCQNITPVALTSSDFQINLTNPNLLNFNNSTFTATSSDAFASTLPGMPKLTNPVNPLAYGAVGDGTTDNTAAFTAALKSGDLLIPSGTYVVSGIIQVPAGRNIQCASLSSVKIVIPNPTSATDQGNFHFWQQGGSLSNCHFSGTEEFIAKGSPVYNDTFGRNWMVTVDDTLGVPAANITLINNVFENCHATSCLAVNGYSTAVDRVSVVYNTFNNCADRGVSLSGVTNNLAAHNRFTNCSLAIFDYSLLPNLNNIFEYNALTATYGTTFDITHLVGDYPGDGTVDFSSNLVRYNTVQGNGIQGSININRHATKPAQYIENICIDGCSLFPKY